MTAAGLPGYVLEGALGRGAMGTVHLARRADWAGRLVAVKRVPGAAPGLARRLRHEAEVLAALDHPHIVRILDLVPDGDGVAIAMQYAAGGSLPDLLARRPRLSPGEVVAVAVPLAGALASAHRRGLLHCDVKPANVLFTSDGEPLLSDFGLARRVAPPGSPASSASPAGGGPVTGTAEYVDPVVAAGGHADQRSDVYGLGAVCYELLSGRPPYSAPTAEAVLAAALAGPPPPLGPAAHEAPLALVQAVERAMARNPADRFPDAAAFAAALRAAAPAVAVALAVPSDLGPPAGGAAPISGPPPTPDPLSASRALHPAFWPGDGSPDAPAGGPPADDVPLLAAAGPDGAQTGPTDLGPVTDRPGGARLTREFGPHPPRPAAEPVPLHRVSRGHCLAAAAGLVVVLGAGAALTRTTPGHSITATAAAATMAGAHPRPCPAAAGPLRADDDGDGCPSTVVWQGNVAAVGGRRYALGRPGDALVVGDWDCDGRATPALYRSTTGDVFLFDAWAGHGPVVAERDGGRRAANGVASVERDAGSCDLVVVRAAG